MIKSVKEFLNKSATSDLTSRYATEANNTEPLSLLTLNYDNSLMEIIFNKKIKTHLWV